MEITLDNIFKERQKFIQQTGKRPKTIYMTKQELWELKESVRWSISAEREKDLEERLRPDLLPPMRQCPEIKENDYVYGMCIQESMIGGLSLSIE